MNNVLKSSLIIVLVILLGCSGNHQREIEKRGSTEYANLFNLICSKTDTILKIKDNFYNNSNQFTSYILKHDNTKLKTGNLSRNTIKTPLRRVICMSTGHIAYLNLLEELNSIIAVSGGRYINNNQINKKINSGQIVDIGYESSLNFEMIMALKPDMIFAYGISGENNSYIDKLRQMGIPVLVLGDFSENHPLGKLEYIKLFGALFEKKELADSIFNAKKTVYNSIRENVLKVKSRPKVMLNAPWKETWYVPGDESYMTKLISDAGAEVLGVKQNSSKSGSSSIEEVYKLSFGADFWLNPNSYKSIKTLTDAVPLFKNINAVNSGNVFNNIKKITPSGGSDFWENGVVEPEVILEDLVKIFHPELLPNHELQYYIRLK